MKRSEFIRAKNSDVVVYPYKFHGQQRKRTEVIFDHDFGYDVDLNSTELPQGCPEELRGALSGNVVEVKIHKTANSGSAYLW